MTADELDELEEELKKSALRSADTARKLHEELFTYLRIIMRLIEIIENPSPDEKRTRQEIITQFDTDITHPLDMITRLVEEEKILDDLSGEHTRRDFQETLQIAKDKWASIKKGEMPTKKGSKSEKFFH